MNLPNIYDYFDYRLFLQEYYTQRKQQDPTFSHRKFLSDAGIQGSVYLHRVLNNQRALTEQFIPNFVKALTLPQKESAYFKSMVFFCNEKSAERKELFIKEMMALRCENSTYRIQDKKLRFFEKWYYPIIRELVIFSEFNDDFNQLSKKVIPKISAAQAQSAFNYLIENGFIQKNENGQYTQAAPLISSGDRVKSTILRTYHKKVLQHCSDALDTIPSQDRDITSLTLSVSKKTYKNIKTEIQQFRKHLLTLAQNDSDPEMVCLVGFQLIPRSKAASEGNSKV